jgi:hypothetical protein
VSRPAAIARRSTRRTVSRHMAETLAEAAIKRGCTAAIVFPDGVRIELTPGPAPVEGDAPNPDTFAGLQ